MKPSSFDAEFFTDSDELDEPDMIFFNFYDIFVNSGREFYNYK